MKIIVLGAGYGSLAFLKSLSAQVRRSCQICLISDSPLHYFSVLLHEVLAGVDGHYTLELNQILPSEIELVQDRVVEIQEGHVVGELGTYAYNYLIVGLGFARESFGVLGVEEYTHGLTNYAGAQASHQALLHAIKVFDQARPFNVVVCGGGLSGVELVGALSDTLPRLCAPKTYQLTCVEAMPSILPMFTPKLVQRGIAYLQKKGIKLELGAKILECQSGKVLVEQGQERREILADFLVWTCGVRGNAVIQKSSLFKSLHSRVEVNGFLEPMDLSEEGVFVLGDCALLKSPEGKFYPPSAQLASQMGTYLGTHFAQILEHKRPTTPFVFTSKGLVCSLGAHYAIGHVGGFNISGKWCIWVKKYIEWCWKRNIVT
ncbi:NAD(P)/FAD-dependent oxidoreductase [Helicobacter salomonis]|uniref:NAD(P)/FAD-dependent oxidoreductase n=1 Tax=Helicobacter salomonis TaxID=56878 RepID=UPI000CF0AEBA|nr:FAD-dependent oxidoreductase [Helicobacter salomonis]